jgi:hypothetical protein
MKFGASADPVDLVLACDKSDTPTTFRLRPLTGPELLRAQMAPGPRPVAGLRTFRRVEEGLEVVGALSPEDRASYERALDWTVAQRLELAALGLVAVDGEPVADVASARALLLSIRPAGLFGAAVVELSAKVEELSDLPPKSQGC